MNTENNKIIAEFLGYDTIVGITVVSVIKNNQLMVFNPNSDWNWLMEVVEKIETLNYDFQILGGKWVIIKDIDPDRNESEEVVETSSETKLLTVYDACIEFIKWYNEQK